MTDLLNASYILDGVPMPVSPAKMLRECTLEPPLEPDGDPATVADEHLDQDPRDFTFTEKDIDSYANAVEGFKRSLPLRFAGPYTAGRVANALLDAIWMNGHFRMGDLTLKVDWKWKDSPIGLTAAFYDSVEAACGYIDSLGVKISQYSLTSGAPSVSFKATTVAEEDAPEDEESLLRELPYRTANPRISRRRKAGATFVPEASDWIIYIPFDSCDYRLGGSAMAQAVGASPSAPPEIGDADYFIDCYEVVRELVEDGIVKAGVTVGDGGLLPALRSMCSAGTGAEVCISDICKAYGDELPVRILFSEVPGVILQISDIDYDYVDAELILQDVVYFPLGHPVPGKPSVEISEHTDLPHILESLMSSMEGED
ncbi:MAG: hypothetical protein IJU21_05395 [Bacteroidales bacterium]|nr:hypothetical protein [Bacteroidales bacterium]